MHDAVLRQASFRLEADPFFVALALASLSIRMSIHTYIYIYIYIYYIGIPTFVLLCDVPVFGEGSHLT